MEALEVGALGLIASLDQRVKASLDERADAAAEHRLLAEEVGFGLFLEGRLQNSGAGAADALQVAEAEGVRLAGGVLMDGDQSWDAAALGEDLADAMAGGLGRGHADVDVLGGDDGLVVNVEAVGEHEQLAGGQVGADLLGVELGLALVGGEDHHHVGPFGDLGGRADFQAGLLRLADGLGGRLQADLHLDAGILEVESVGVALGAVADDGYLLGLNQGQVGILIVVSLRHDFFFLPLLG